MSIRTRLWAATLAVALVGGLLVVAAGFDEAEAATQRTLVIPSAAFVPNTDGPRISPAHEVRGRKPRR